MGGMGGWRDGRDRGGGERGGEGGREGEGGEGGEGVVLEWVVPRSLGPLLIKHHIRRFLGRCHI